MFPSGLMPYKAFGGKLEEFRNRLDIPIGVPDINMAQVGGNPPTNVVKLERDDFASAQAESSKQK